MSSDAIKAAAFNCSLCSHPRDTIPGPETQNWGRQRAAVQSQCLNSDHSFSLLQHSSLAQPAMDPQITFLLTFRRMGMDEGSQVMRTHPTYAQNRRASQPSAVCCNSWVSELLPIPHLSILEAVILPLALLIFSAVQHSHRPTPPATFCITRHFPINADVIPKSVEYSEIWFTCYSLGSLSDLNYRKSNPFFQGGQCSFLLAVGETEPVGR